MRLNYPLSRPNREGTEIWCPAADMTSEQMRGALAVLESDGHLTEAARLREFGHAKFGPEEKL
jgi:hypothetical protein